MGFIELEIIFSLYGFFELFLSFVLRFLDFSTSILRETFFLFFFFFTLELFFFDFETFDVYNEGNLMLFGFVGGTTFSQIS
jgi:hypothetical protein